MIFDLTSPSLLDKSISAQVTEHPDFMHLHEINFNQAINLQTWHDSQIGRGVIQKPDVKMLRESFLFMKAASAFAVMHKSPDEFLQLMVEVNKRG